MRPSIDFFVKVLVGLAANPECTADDVQLADDAYALAKTALERFELLDARTAAAPLPTIDTLKEDAE